MSKIRTLSLWIVAGLWVTTGLAASGPGRATDRNARPTPNTERASATTQAATTTQTPEADPGDVDSMEHIIKAVYDVISGPAGRPRKWDRMRSMFIPGARLIATVPVKDSDGYVPRVATVEQYISLASAYFDKEGFFEKEIARRTEKYGHIAQVFSTYESRHSAADAKPFERGINSFQLTNDGKRWWIVTIFWEGESDKVKIPPEYLKGAR